MHARGRPETDERTCSYLALADARIWKHMKGGGKSENPRRRHERYLNCRERGIVRMCLWGWCTIAHSAHYCWKLTLLMTMFNQLMISMYDLQTTIWEIWKWRASIVEKEDGRWLSLNNLPANGNIETFGNNSTWIKIYHNWAQSAINDEVL